MHNHLYTLLTSVLIIFRFVGPIVANELNKLVSSAYFINLKMKMNSGYH